MIPEHQLTAQPTSPAPAPQPQPLPPRSLRLRNGKVARLPKTTRDQINEMIQDGVPYLKIIERLGDAVQGVNEDNLSNWKSGGYNDWLREQQLVLAIQLRHELAQAIVARAGEGGVAQQAILQIISTNLCEFLAETDPAELRASLFSDADKFTRFANSMVRLAEGNIKCELHKHTILDRAADAPRNKSNRKPGISDESLQLAEQKLNLL